MAALANVSVIVGVSVNVKPDEQQMTSDGAEDHRIRTRIRIFCGRNTGVNSAELKD